MAAFRDEGFSLCGCLFDACFDPSASEDINRQFFPVADNSSTSSGARLEVASARWGTGENSVDVTSDVAAMIEADELTIPMRLKFAKVFGDPAVSAVFAHAPLFLNATTRNPLQHSVVPRAFLSVPEFRHRLHGLRR